MSKCQNVNVLSHTPYSRDLVHATSDFLDIEAQTGGVEVFTARGRSKAVIAELARGVVPVRVPECIRKVVEMVETLRRRVL